MTYTEECDTKAGGCTADCKKESGYNCEGGVCSKCGNGKVEGTEECDNGGLTGCSKCKVESGWRCSKASPSICTAIPNPGCNNNGIK